MKIKIKLKQRHPNNAMQFGRHVVTNQEQVIELNELEIKDLKSEGPKHWFEFEEVKGSDENSEPKKKVSKKVSKKVD